MLARAGGGTIRPEIAQVTVQRGGQTGKIWFQDLYENPAMDIALRGGEPGRVIMKTPVFKAAFTGPYVYLRIEKGTITATQGGVEEAILLA